MVFSNERLNEIFDRTDGRCHICGKKLAFKNYGCLGARGAWEVEHSNPKAKGGTNRLNNLFPACIFCNRSKGAGSAKAARAHNGRVKAPLSKAKKEDSKFKNAILGGAVGGLVGSLGGKNLAMIGAMLGAKVGFDQDPEE